jgi:hypothetical protein
MGTSSWEAILAAPRDGAERQIDAGFTRYGVVFTGETLPDGRKADAVYIMLNDPYRDVVNHAVPMPPDERPELTEGTLSAMAIRRRRVSRRYRNVTGFFCPTA